MYKITGDSELNISSMNKTIVMGNVGSDAKITHLKNGGNVINFNLAVNESFKNKDSEKVTQTTWYEVEVWNREALLPFLKKGKTLSVDGTAKATAFINKEGNAEAKLGLKANEIFFV